VQFFAARYSRRVRSGISTLVAFGLHGLFLSGCSESLKAPTLKPEQVTTSRISTDGADFEAVLDGFNPNSKELTARSVTTKLNIGGRAEAAKVSIASSLVLPPKQNVKVKVPIKVEWTDKAAIAALAATKQPVTYLVEGTAEFSDGRTSINVPLQVSGPMTAAELAQAAGTR